MDSPESHKHELETRREEDIQKMVGLCRNICKIDVTSRDVRRALRLGKATENNERPLLIARQREELKGLIKEANQKEQQDETGSFMYRVRGPPWMWRIKKIVRNK